MTRALRECTGRFLWFLITASLTTLCACVEVKGWLASYSSPYCMGPWDPAQVESLAARVLTHGAISVGQLQYYEDESTNVLRVGERDLWFSGS